MFIVSIVVVMFCGAALNADNVNFKGGIFFPQLKSDLWTTNMENLVFEKKDMQSEYYALEFEHFLDRNISLSFEGGYYKKEHLSFYRDYEYNDGSPINQNLSLEMANLEVGFKFYPLGSRLRFCPYLGAGAGVYYWKYKQWGDFINFDDNSVDQDKYAESSAYTPGFNAKGGFVFRFSRFFGVSAEARYQFVKGSLSSFFEGFEKLDMSGFTSIIGINFYF
jgi:hypothetical protein